MKQRKAKRPTHQSSKSPPKKVRCRKLVRVDSRPIRDKAKKDYEKAKRDLERARVDLDRYQSEDKPAYTRWLHRNFGQLLTELREKQQALHQKQELIREIETVALFEGLSYKRAYDRVMWRREREEQAAADPDSPGDEEDEEDQDPFEGSGASGPNSDSFEEEINEMFEEFEEAFRAFFGFDFNSAEEEKSAAQDRPEKERRVKDLYRALVRKLHPDAQSEATPQQLERWHQVQAAYEAHDHEQLEVLLALCEVEEKGTKNVGSVSLLTRITRQLKSSLRQIRSQLTQCRRDPAWKFSRRTEAQTRDLKGQTERYLGDELEEVQAELDQLQRQLNRLSTPAGKKRRSTSRRSRGSRRQTEFWF